MGAFELDNAANNCCNSTGSSNNNSNNSSKLKDECLIALKVYDFCRQQDCLTSDILGPARYAECYCSSNAGDVINPPDEASSVTIDNLCIEKVIIVNKKKNAFKNGFWDVDLKYVFRYTLTFRDAGGNVIDRPICANSIFTKRVTLFGSIGTDVTLSTDLFNTITSDDSFTLEADPFIWVESKAVGLNAELKYKGCCSCNCGCGTASANPSEPNEVHVTIGLFTIIKLFRIVNLLVQSKGFCIPDECEDISPLNPCEFFDNLDFPMDMFAPPQRPEFLAGISGNIPHKNKNCNSTGNASGGCGCGCGCGGCGCGCGCD